jgi:hypothetical protein
MTSLIIRNDENQTYNPKIDNYMVLSTNNYSMTEASEIQSLLDCVNNSHQDKIMVEVQNDGYDMLSFLENIGKISIHRADRKGIVYYTTIQKVLENAENN